MKYIGLGLVCLQLVACSGVSSASSSTDEYSAASSTSQHQHIISAPNIADYTYPNYPDTLYQIGEIIDLEYEVTTPQESFLEGLQNINQTQYHLLDDRSNFFQLGPAILFFSNETPHGRGRLIIDYGNGIYQEILSSTQPIMSVEFSMTKHSILVELGNTIGWDWYESNYYELNFVKSTLEPIQLNLTRNTLGKWNEIYCENLLLVEVGDDAVAVGDSWSIYNGTTHSEPNRLIHNTSYFQFANGAIYYLSNDKKSIECLTTEREWEKKIIFSLDHQIQSFTFDGESLYIWTTDQLYYCDNITIGISLQMHLDDLVLLPYGTLVCYSSNTIYWVTLDNYLAHISETGEIEYIISDFKTSGPVLIYDEWIYFTSYQTVPSTRFSEWKMQLNGEGLTLLSEL